MLSAISAEAIKFTRHRATWGLVWIWPLGLILLYMIAIGVDLAGADEDTQPGGGLQGWIANAAGFWNVPGHPIGRYLIGAFVAVVFAGEYGWNTWKLIVPHRARTTLIGAKYAVSFGLLALGFIAAALLFNALGWIEDVVTGDPIPAGITYGALAQAHGAGMLAVLGPVLLTIAYVSLAAILTRSTVGALVIGIVVTTFEQVFTSLAPALAPYAPGLVAFLHQALPGYHLTNIASFVGQGQALAVPFPGGPLAATLGFSLAVVAAWIVGLVGFTLWRFQKQDLN
jgi:ABC-2 type transport system permease protein